MNLKICKRDDPRKPLIGPRAEQCLAPALSDHMQKTENQRSELELESDLIATARHCPRPPPGCPRNLSPVSPESPGGIVIRYFVEASRT